MTTRTNRILLVDDEVNILNALKRSLRNEPYEIVATTSAHDGLIYLRGEDFDLVLSDYLMPEMSGLDFLNRARQLAPDSMRLMLTGNGKIDTVVSAINDGSIYRFLTKPWDNAELRMTLRLCFERLQFARENRRLLETMKGPAHGSGEFERRTRELQPCRCEVDPS